MTFMTKYNGEINLLDYKVLSFSDGIPGFEAEQQFVLLPFDDDGMFFILQSAQTSQLAFVVTNPFLFFPQYDFEVDEQTILQWDIKEQSELVVFVILTIPEQFKFATANLQAPLLIHPSSKQGKQLILAATDYKTKHRIFAEQPLEAKG